MGGTTTYPVATYLYDNRLRPAGTTATSDASTSLTYNGLGRVTTEALAIGANAVETVRWRSRVG